MNRSLSILVALLVWPFAATACQEGRAPVSEPAAEKADAGRSATASADGPCEHSLPKHLCTKCTPSLVPVFKSKGDWCDEHGFPESYCPICNPDATVPTIDASPVPAADWCVGHGLPESKCTKCNPELLEGFKAAGDWCEAHAFPESVCPICNPQAPPAGAEASAIEARVVRFRSEGIERSVGLQTIAAQRSASASIVEAPAQIDFDADRVAEVRALVPGIVRALRVEIGAQVQAGDPIVELESTEVGQIQGALQSARERVRAAEAHLERQRALLEQDVASRRTIEVAERELATARAEVRTAQSALRMTGASGSKSSGRYTVSAPIAGTVVRRPAILGQNATQSESFATIADTSVMWALLDIPEADIGDIAMGQKVSVTFKGRGGDQRVDGELTWISAEVNPRTRTVSVRAELPNTEGRLRAKQFAQAQIEVGARTTGVRVPRAAVQRVGELEVVFVRAAPGVYQPRVVKRSGEGSIVGVEGRIEAGEQVVTTGAVLLRTEIMPGSIGAGCCEVD